MRSRGFTLLEVVLAIGLTGAVLALLTSAIELYMLRVDTSRSRVESAQLARTLLTMISEDLQAARYYAAEAGTAESDATETSENAVDYASDTLGIFGNETELHIDRSAVWQWERLTRQLDPSSMTRPEEMPQTIRYLLSDGKELLADRLAAAGVAAEPLPTGYAGLYREQTVSVAQDPDSEFGGNSDFGGQRPAAQLLAPEVVEIGFAYFDGETLLPEWDSAERQGLPKGVEIRLKLLEEPFEVAVARQRGDRRELRENQQNLKEYRLFVRLPNVRPPRYVAPSRSKQSEEEQTP
ncbi:MAG: hypothetical protein MI725_07925 [Pirellulales bacterium]|nr:hypothetical protein [Pirellulales bacterium]